MPTRISGLTSPLTHIVGSLVTRVYLLAPGLGNHPCPNQGCINVRATKPAAAEPETVVSFPSFFSSIPPLFKFNLSESESYKTNKNKKRPNKHQPQKQAPRQSRNRLQNQLLSSPKPLHQTQLPPLVRPSPRRITRTSRRSTRTLLSSRLRLRARVEPRHQRLGNPL